MPGPLAPYEALVVLAEAQCAHVRAGRLAELEQVQEEFGRRLAELHGPAPDGAEELLRRAFALHEQATVGLLALRAGISDELAQVRRARRAAAGYGAPMAQEAGRAVNHAA